MSLETWKQEFYPKRATETTPEEAIQHSLTKWQGLLPENLAKHDVHIDSLWHVASDDADEGKVALNSRTCSLCLHHYRSNGCGLCPLYQVRGCVACDEERKDEDFSPWSRIFHSNPEPMIGWLEVALADQSEK
jgi:hypothetical protein